MSDTYLEKIVKRKLGPWRVLAKIGIAVGTAALIYALFCIFLSVQAFSYGAFAFFLLFALGWLAWRWSISMNVEFEYTVTSGELDIDRIIAKRKRKRMITVRTTELEQMAPYDDAHREIYDTYECTSTINAASSPKSADIWFVTCNTRKYGKARILFEPSDRMIEDMRVHSPRKVDARPLQEASPEQ